MIKKILVLGLIIAAASALVYSQFGSTVDKYLPVSAVAQDLDSLKDTTTSRVNHEIDKTVDTVGSKIEQIKPAAEEINPIKKIEEKITMPEPKTYRGQVYEKNQDQSCKISVPKLARTVNGIKELTYTITLPDCQFEKHQPVQITQTPNSGYLSSSQPSDATSFTVTAMPSSQIFDTLQLKTVRNMDNTVSIQYEDTSGKTLKVTVNLRNSEKQLFSGEFFASKFDTNVNDVSNSPHIIEMIVEHADYGTVYSSVFNPQGNEQTTINGVFTK
ncbi:hypothetical protein [Candidatus Nitrosotenuis uzonensis]|uniref:Uncharacterized protein n=1 Tax=Candidatus Nitrosotenuis uzonensis TaxID=1407055 RepID=V6AVL1_9ARCH|nr:hypothetical protein [Candidatus Nitrosotenuis uzonensis]CDI06613.1 conserved exported hypothetical protein [Candidatus Nitrosotenuis uzonensis]